MENKEENNGEFIKKEEIQYIKVAEEEEAEEPIEIPCENDETMFVFLNNCRSNRQFKFFCYLLFLQFTYYINITFSRC